MMGYSGVTLNVHGRSLVVIPLMLIILIVFSAILLYNPNTIKQSVITRILSPTSPPLVLKRPAIMYQDPHSPPEGFEGAIKILKELKPSMVWYSKGSGLNVTFNHI